MNFDDEAGQYAMELDRIKSLGGRKKRLLEILRWAYAKGRASTVQDAYVDGAKPPAPPPPLTFELENS